MVFIILDIVLVIIQDKVIFGTDYPVLPFRRTIEDIDALELKPQVRRKLLRDNAVRIYGLTD